MTPYSCAYSASKSSTVAWAMMRRMLMCDVRVFGSTLLIRFDFIDRKNVRECSEVRKADGSQNSSRVVSRSEEHTSELQSLMRISYAVFCLKKKKITTDKTNDE